MVWVYPDWHPKTKKGRRKPYNRYNDPKWRSPWSCMLCTKFGSEDDSIFSDCMEKTCKHFPEMDKSDVRI